MYVSASRVGIGTTNPITDLHFNKSNGDGSAEILFQNTNGASPGSVSLNLSGSGAGITGLYLGGLGQSPSFTYNFGGIFPDNTRISAGEVLYVETTGNELNLSSNGKIVLNPTTQVNIGENVVGTQILNVSGSIYIESGFSLYAQGTKGKSGQVLTSTATGSTWIDPAGGGGISEELSIVYAIALG